MNADPKAADIKKISMIIANAVTFKSWKSGTELFVAYSYFLCKYVQISLQFCVFLFCFFTLLSRRMVTFQQLDY